MVDVGKPYELDVNEKELMKELKDLEEIAEESLYCDVFIYHGEKDVTDSMFKKYFKKRNR